MWEAAWATTLIKLVCTVTMPLVTGQLKVCLHTGKKKERDIIMNKVLYSLAYYLSTSNLLFHINYIYSLMSSLIYWRTHTQGNKLLEITKILNKIGKVQKKKYEFRNFSEDIQANSHGKWSSSWGATNSRAEIVAVRYCSLHCSSDITGHMAVQKLRQTEHAGSTDIIVAYWM